MKHRSQLARTQLILGILMVVLGIAALIRPLSLLTGFVIACGIMAIILGIFDIVFYIRAERFSGAGPLTAVITGVLSIMVGVMLLIFPDAGRMVLCVLFPIWFIAHSAAQLAQADILRLTSARGYYLLSVITAIIGIILGFLLLLQPLLSGVALGWMIGLYLILLGAAGIVLSFSRHNL
ncbi:MAG: HdeD family acid-resistance protein [Anaerovoracaceae bacterium]|jgi:uncharacterized membrane protein HdeD (DUF308 family)